MNPNLIYAEGHDGRWCLMDLTLCDRIGETGPAWERVTVWRTGRLHPQPYYLFAIVERKSRAYLLSREQAIALFILGGMAPPEILMPPPLEPPPRPAKKAKSRKIARKSKR